MLGKTAGNLLTAAAVLFVSPVLAQDGKAPAQHEMTPEQKAEMEAYMKAGTPGAAHKAMAATAGTYALEVKSWHEPGKPPMVDSGTAVRTMLYDGRVMVEEMTSTMMGAPYSGRATMGYDNVSGKHWSTWTDSMSTGVMMSEGTCDAANACTYTGSYNDPVKKGKATMRMTTRWTSPTTQVLEMYAPGKDGKEMKMMEITYTKK